jgi:hypothetical protein
MEVLGLTRVYHEQAPVLLPAAPSHIAVLLQPVNQFDSTVMFQRHARCKQPGRGLVVSWQPTNRQQH